MKGDERPTILGLSIAFPIIAIIAVVLRFQARRVNRVELGADDWTILGALVLTIGVTIVILLDSRLGNLGWHTHFNSKGIPLDDSTFRSYGKAALALQVFVWPCVGLTKISVLLLYKRIFIGQTFRRIVWSMIFFCIAWTIAFEFSVIFSFQWDPSVKPRCVNQIVLFRTALATDVVTDGLILFLPVYNVWKLQMRTPQKIAVIGIFFLGGFTTVTGIIRLHFLTYAYASLKHPLFNDVTYNYAPAFYWSIIETNTGVLSACLPTLRPLFRPYPITSSLARFFKSFTGSFRSISHSSKAEIRLNSLENSMEAGLNETRREALGVNHNKAYAEHDSSFARPQSPTNIHYQRTYSASDYSHPGRESEEICT